MNRDPDIPWLLGRAAEVTPTEFEHVVREWLVEWAQRQGLKIEATHQGTVHGSGGEYAIDVLVTTEVFRGAQISILVECKHQQRPVERDELLILEGKLRDVGAHKGMLFSTSGFQSGALQYAHAHKIATISIREGRSLFETRGVGPSPDAPPWAQIDRVVGIRARVSM